MLSRFSFLSTLPGSFTLIILLISFPLTAQEPAAKEANAEFLKLRQRVQLGLRHTKFTERLEAIKLLEPTHGVDAAKLLIQRGLTHADAEIRRAAYEQLLLFADDQPTFAHLYETVSNDVRRASVTDQTAILLRVLLAAEKPGLKTEVENWLAFAAEHPDSARPLLIRLAEGLVVDADEPSFRLLTHLTRAKLFHNEFGTRRSIVQGITHFRTKPAVSELIALLKKSTGEVRADILKHLAAISGQKFSNQSEWQEWWETNEAKFEFPPVGQAAALAAATPLLQSSSSYYDIPLTATRVVFVIDTSRSMAGARFVRAQEELSRSIAALQPNTYFNVLAFDHTVSRWQIKLVEANAKNKHAALRFVERLQLGRFTASFDALKAALSYDTESIYFLTDGEPSGGRIDDPVEISRLITSENRFRRVTIHSIGIGVGLPGSEFDKFLSILASENWGEYRRVDE